VSGTLDAPAIEAALARGVHGFIVKPFKADTVLRTIRNTVIAVVRKQQAAAGDNASA
jgi:two-component system chemotaxis response regulator CheY